MTKPAGGFRVHLLPSTRAGWASVVLAVLSAVTFFVFFRLLEAGAETYHLPFVGVGTAIAGGLVALEAIIRRHERGLLLAGPIIWGLMWAGFLAGEFTNPH